MRVTYDTVQLPNGAWSYRLLLGTRVLIQSGGFLLRQDADNIGRHFAAEPDILAFIKD